MNFTYSCFYSECMLALTTKEIVETKAPTVESESGNVIISHAVILYTHYLFNIVFKLRSLVSSLYNVQQDDDDLNHIIRESARERGMLTCTFH